MNTKLYGECASYRKNIYNFILKSVGYNQDLAQDLTQETYCKIFTYFKKYNLNEKEYLRTWMFRVAKNIIIDYFREQKYVLQCEIETDNYDVKYYDVLISDTNIQKEFENKELQVEIERIVSELSPKQRESFDAMKLHDLDGLEYSEITKIINRSNDSLRKGTSRLKITLREKLSDTLQN
jgi:RNA polymerase sigma-70 factor (ECF subfamily)